MGKGIGIIGFGKTGRSTLDFLLRRKEISDIVIYDDMKKGEFEHISEEYGKNVSFISKENELHKLFNLEKVIISPGVNGKDKKFSELRNSGADIVSEIEFAFSYIKCPVVAVTGSNGKSTTVSLIHHFLKSSGKDSILAGNIGTPLISFIDSIKEDSIVVLEVSSFQLEEIKEFKPYVSVILNITPDHLDRYDKFEDYVNAKLNIVLNQDRKDYLVLNSRDSVINKHFSGKGIDGPKKIWFPDKKEGFGNFACLKDSGIKINLPGKTEIISLANNPLLGMHNVENIMAASVVASIFNIDAGKIENALAGFRGLPHRMEVAGNLGNVLFINDSKATNIDATLKAIRGTSDDLVIILGGKDKGGDFSVFGEFMGSRVKQVLLIGDATEKIADQLDEKSEYLTEISGFEEGIRIGYEILKLSGGTVLLSPGCASYDMFNNFEERGNLFKKCVADFTGSEKNG